MGWMREHSMIFYGIGVGLVVLVGAVLVSNKFRTDTDTTQYTWGSYGGASRFTPGEVFDASLQDPLLPEKKLSIAELYRNLETNPDRTHASFVSGNIPLLSDLKDAAQSGGALQFTSESIDEFLASLKPSATTKNLLGGDTQDTAYYYVSQTIVPPPPRSTNDMTEAERALYNYGNDAGAPIELYGILWGNTQAFVHRGFAEDRTDEKKRSDLLRLADALSDVSESLKVLDFMPESVTSRHAKLADAYETIAEKTRTIAKANTDEELLTAIDDYNKAAEEFLAAYLALANVFALNNISYPETEPGRVFVYSGQPEQQ